MSREHKFLRRCFAALAIFVGGAAFAGDALKAGVFDPPHPAPDFVLEGSNGAPLRLSSFRGKVVVLGFGFSSCPKVCPTTLAVLAAARSKLGDAAGDVQVVYVTVDPQRDTAVQMKKYLETFDVTFIGGTGTPQALAQVRAQFGIQAEKHVYGDSYTMGHTSSLLLIDRDGLLRALMPYGHSPDDYVHDLSILLKERRRPDR